LARTAWGEARGEGWVGMQAVINVVMNRVQQSGWDIERVCLAPYQFSCWNAGDPNRAKLTAVGTDDPQYREALTLAQDSAAHALADMTHGADHYFTGTVPSWAKGVEPVAVIGHHQFYRLGWPRPLPPAKGIAMADTISTTPTVVTPAASVVYPSVNDMTSQGTAAIASGAAAAITILLTNALAHYGLTIDTQSASAIIFLLTLIFHFSGVSVVAKTEPVKPTEPAA
jgi:hypothetical protein